MDASTEAEAGFALAEKAAAADKTLGRFAPFGTVAGFAAGVLALHLYFQRYDLNLLDVAALDDVLIFLVVIAAFAAAVLALMLALAESAVGLLIFPLCVIALFFPGLGVRLFPSAAASAVREFALFWAPLCLPAIALWSRRALVAARFLPRGDRRLEGPVYLIAAVLALLLGVDNYAHAREQSFYSWDHHHASGYAAQVRGLSPELDACPCGAGVIWSGAKATVLRCGRRTVVVRDAQEMVIERAPPARSRPERSSLSGVLDFLRGVFFGGGVSVEDLRAAEAAMDRACPAPAVASSETAAAPAVR